MSRIRGKVGAWELEWLSPPSGDRSVGSVQVDVKGHGTVEVAWRRDAHGIWLELPDGVYGFDIAGEKDDSERTVYRATERCGENEWSGVAFARAGAENDAVAGSGARKSGVRVRAQMPGKIVRVMAKQGARVAKDEPLVVMEAMKMENEIRAPQAGKVSAVKVTAGQAVEAGVDLLLIEAE